MNDILAVLDEQTLVVPDGYEMVDGRLVERKMSTKSSWVGGQLLLQLGMHCAASNIGWVWPADQIYRCFANPRTARKPDVSFIRRDRLPEEGWEEGELHLAPDLAVEVVSPNETVYELDVRVEEYLAAGVRLVWVVNPESRIALIHRLDGTMAKVRDGHELSGEDVVPGFRCPLAACLRPLPDQRQSDGNGRMDMDEEPHA
jgi:Uma2 family endonuclease